MSQKISDMPKDQFNTTTDQTTLTLLLNFIEFGMLPKEAVLYPRISTSLYQNSFDPETSLTYSAGDQRVGKHAAVVENVNY